MKKYSLDNLDKGGKKADAINSLIMEVASDFAHKELEDNWRDSIKIYEDEGASITNYTEEAQDIFNEYYDIQMDILYNLVNECIEVDSKF